VRMYGRAISQAAIQEIVGDIYRKTNEPSPDDGTEGLGDLVVLEWDRGGAFSKSYDIYWGPDFNDVNDASRGDTLGAELVNTGAIVYDINGLEYGQTYYWRVDGVAENGYACKGDIWEFSTTGNSLVGWWKFDGDMVDSSGNGRDGSLKLTGGAGSYSYVDGPFGGQAFESVNGAYVGIDGSGDAGWAQMRYDSMTIAMWMRSTDPYYHCTLISKGSDAYMVRQSGTTTLGRLKAYAYGPESYGPTTTVNSFDGEWHHVAMVLDRDENRLKMYVDGEFNVYSSTGSLAMVSNSEDLAIGACPAAGSSIYFRGAIDDVRIYDYAVSDADIEAMANPTAASMPWPEDEASAVGCDVVLSWEAGDLAESHDVYLGTEQSEVETGTVSDAVFKGNFDVNSYTVSWLESGRTYYWRIDEVAGVDKVKGIVWEFVTAAGGDFE